MSFKTKTKIELVNSAYQALRISGLTVSAIPEELTVGLEMLENQMYEYEESNICTNFNFSAGSIDPNEESGLFAYTNNAAVMNLATRLVNFFGREVPDGIQRMAIGGLATWASRTARVNMINPSGRQPRGSGSTLRFSNWMRFYRYAEDAPIACSTFELKVDQTDFFTVDFTPYLLEGQTIVSYETKVSNGIQLLNIVQNGPIFTMECKGEYVGYSVIDIKVTTSSGRVNPEAINFNITA